MSPRTINVRGVLAGRLWWPVGEPASASVSGQIVRSDVGQGCDGTIEDNMHFVATHLLQPVGIDYYAAYAEAYPDRSLAGWPRPEQLAWLHAETEFPALADDTLELLLHDLYDTNHRTLEDLLRARLEGLGRLISTSPAARRPLANQTRRHAREHD